MGALGWGFRISGEKQRSDRLERIMLLAIAPDPQPRMESVAFSTPSRRGIQEREHRFRITCGGFSHVPTAGS